MNLAIIIVEAQYIIDNKKIVHSLINFLQTNQLSIELKDVNGKINLNKRLKTNLSCQIIILVFIISYSSNNSLVMNSLI